MELEIKKEKGKENQEQYRVVINKEASDALEKMLSMVSNDFDAGEITKSDIATWVIMTAVQSFGEAEIKSVRQLHFDERKILASILKDSRSENKLPESVKRAIREHYGLTEPNKKRVPKD